MQSITAGGEQSALPAVFNSGAEGLPLASVDPMKLAFRPSAAVLLLTLCALVQQPAAAEEKPGSISGTVMTAEGKPLPRATVTLESERAKLFALTDEKGSFAFLGLQPGSYRLRAEKTAYAPASRQLPATEVELAAGQHLAGATVKMIALGAITGQVRDENGDPIVQARVTAFRRDAQAPTPPPVTTPPDARFAPFIGPPRPRSPAGWVPGGDALTDDRGEFRIHSLLPGSYYVTVQGWFLSGKVYGPLSYPSAPPADETAALQIKPGTELPLNFTMQPAAPVRPPNAPPPNPAPEQFPDPASISGQVLSSHGTPLARVAVNLGSSGPTQKTVTDERGRFEFSNVHAGPAMITVEKAGYSAGPKGYDYLARQLTAGEHADDVVVKMFPLAAITGRVLDENGEPIAGVNVDAMEVNPDAGGKVVRYSGFNVPTTNDRGEFRIHSLAPGRYVIRVTSKRNPADKLYPSIFHPATPSVEGATVFTVRPGDELSANFTMRPTTGVAVRGHVRGVTGDKLSVTLEQRDSERIALFSPFFLPSAISTSAAVRPDGSFELRNIPTGKYVVKGTFPLAATNAPAGGHLYPRESRADVDVGEKDVEGVEITPAEPMESVIIKGTARCDCPPGAKILRATMMFHDLEGAVVATGLRGYSMSAQAAPDLTFTLEAPVGARVELSGLATTVGASGERTAAFIKTASFGDKDVADSEFTIARGMAATPLELVYSPTYPTVEGVVLDSHDQPVANVHIMGIPEERYRNRGAYSSHFFTADTNPKGEFTYPYALPGEYTLLAFQFDLFSGEELPATDVLLKKHGGQVIKLAEKEHYRVVLHLIDLEER